MGAQEEEPTQPFIQLAIRGSPLFPRLLSVLVFDVVRRTTTGSVALCVCAVCCCEFSFIVRVYLCLSRWRGALATLAFSHCTGGLELAERRIAGGMEQQQWRPLQRANVAAASLSPMLHVAAVARSKLQEPP